MNKMTEAEFKDVLSEELLAASDENFSLAETANSIAELVKRVILCGSLSIAPAADEPLAPRLKYASGLISPVWHDGNPGKTYAWRDQGQKDLHYAEAVRRYNEFLALQRDLAAATLTARESQEVIVELTAALAVMAGDKGLKPCQAPCPGHLGPKALAAFHEALGRWRALEVEPAEAKTELEMENLRQVAAMPEGLERERKLEEAMASMDGTELPERLECGSTPGAVDLWPEQSSWKCFEHRLAGYQAARDRYNALPGLRRAAEKVVETMKNKLITMDEYQSHMALEAELAKGPKP